MKGVVLAGGLGTRLYPLTHATNKNLLPVYNQPMVFYPIQTLKQAGIDEILVVVGGPHAGHFLSVLKDGKDFGLKHLEYAYSDSGGTLAGLSLSRYFVDGDSLAVMYGDNITDTDISTQVKNFREGAQIFLKEVNNPQRFGVAVLDKRNKRKISYIEEKPEKPQSNLAVAGIYLFDNQIFNIMLQCKHSKRGELEITDAVNVYLQKGKLTWTNLKGFWSDAGTFEGLSEANQYWANKKSSPGQSLLL